MFLEIYDKGCGKKYCYLLSYAVIIILIYCVWYSMKNDAWRSRLTLSCEAQGSSNKVTTNSSQLDLVKEVALPRAIGVEFVRFYSNPMVYEKPDVLQPLRSDVLMMTPWFAPIVWTGTYNLEILNAQFRQRDIRIGLTVFAIKRYTVFIPTFIKTAEKYFMKGYKVKYYVFTDRVGDIPNITLSEGRQMVLLEVPSYQRWQEVSMRRMEMIRNYSRQQFVNEVDYLVCVDVDMRFSDDVGVEILSDLFGTLHPGLYDKSRLGFTYERRPESAAYIPGDEGDFYYAGGFFGGIVEEVYKASNFCHNAIMVDKKNGVEAIWHDESYLNNYFLYHKPTKILSPEYLWDNAFGVPDFLKRRRFVAVPKNHAAIRSRRELWD